jgi:hypothetical protein
VDPAEQRIKYYTEWIKILWLTLVANVGGVISLLLGPPWPWKTGLVMAGSVLAAAFLFLIVVLHVVIEKLIGGREESDA